MNSARVTGVLAAVVAAGLVVAGCVLFPPEDTDPTSLDGLEPIDSAPINATSDADPDTYTFWLRDRDTNLPITDGVILQVELGVAPSLNGDGSFTLVKPTHGLFSLEVDGYALGHEYAFEGDKNIIYKRKLAEEVFGEWKLIRISRDNDRQDSYTEPPYRILELAEDGIQRVRGEGAGYFSNDTLYYSTHLTDYGCFLGWSTWELYETDWVGYPVDTTTFPMYYISHYGYDRASDEIHTFGDLIYTFSKDDGAGGGSGGGSDSGLTGTLSYGGSTIAASAVDGGDGVWAITAGGYTVAIVNAPASGSTSLDSTYYTVGNSSATGVQITDATFNAQIAVSGTVTVAPGSLQLSATMKSITDAILGGGQTFPLTVNVD